MEQQQDRQCWTEQGVQASAVRRPDRKWLLQLPSGRTDLWSSLVDRAAREVDGPLLVTGYDTEPRIRELLSSMGFSATRTERRWRIPVAALAAQSVEATWHRLVRVDLCDLDRVVDLDNLVRSAIPGTESWRGTRADLVATLGDDEFDPELYLIAEHTVNRRYDGLVRVWNHAPFPRIGCLGVRRTWRRTRLPVALLGAVAAVLRLRGVQEVTAETDTLNRGSHELAARRGTSTGETTEWEWSSPG